MTHPDSFTPERNSNGHPIIPDWAEVATKENYVEGERVWLYSEFMGAFKIIIDPRFDSNNPYIRAKRQPEKQGEEMQKKFVICGIDGLTGSAAAVLSAPQEIERAYAEVQAWKEKQKAEKELKETDWCLHETSGHILRWRISEYYKKEDHTKITDPDLLAALNKAFPEGK